MAKYQYFIANNLEFYWPDIDNHRDEPINCYQKLWRAVLERALHDLTWDKSIDDNQMLYMRQAHEFFTVDNPVFRTCCEVMNFAESHIKALREFAEQTFKANYIEPAVKEWKRKGRKPKGYREQLAKEMNKGKE